MVFTKTTSEKYLIDVYVPGVDKSELTISIENDFLRIDTVENASHVYNYKIYLPKSYNPDNITAKLINGVLKVEIPRVIKKIEIE